MKYKLLRTRLEFEGVPIMDTLKPIKTEDDFDNIIKDAKLKLFGR